MRGSPEEAPERRFRLIRRHSHVCSQTDHVLLYKYAVDKKELQLAQQSVTAVDCCNGGRPRDGVTAVDRQGSTDVTDVIVLQDQRSTY